MAMIVVVVRSGGLPGETEVSGETRREGEKGREKKKGLAVKGSAESYFCSDDVPFQREEAISPNVCSCLFLEQVTRNTQQRESCRSLGSPDMRKANSSQIGVRCRTRGCAAAAALQA